MGINKYKRNIKRRVSVRKLKDKIINYQNNILQSTKELYVLNQVQKMVSDGMIVNDAVNVQLSKVINQDSIRVEIVEDFIKGVLNNDSELIKLYLDDKININNLSSLFSLIKMLNSNNNYKYQILNYLNYFNNHILLKLKLDKNYIIRFVFDYENKVIGIWLDAINY